MFNTDQEELLLPNIPFLRLRCIEQLYRAWSVNAGHPYHRE